MITPTACDKCGAVHIPDHLREQYRVEVRNKHIAAAKAKVEGIVAICNKEMTPEQFLLKLVKIMESIDKLATAALKELDECQ